jgi:hypothetical protein
VTGEEFVVLDTDVAPLTIKRQLPPALLAQLVGAEVCITSSRSAR